MGQHMQAQVPNKLFPHLADQQIMLTGDQTAVTSIAHLINRNFQVDTRPRVSLYATIARYLLDNHVQDGEVLPTAHHIFALYHSADVKAAASGRGMIVHLDSTSCISDNGNIGLDFQPELLPFVFEAWFKVIGRVGGSPVTQVGVVTRHHTSEITDRFDAAMYSGTASSIQGTCVWFVLDLAQVAKPDGNEWGLIVHPSDSTLALEHLPATLADSEWAASKIPDQGTQTPRYLGRLTSSGDFRSNASSTIAGLSNHIAFPASPSSAFQYQMNAKLNAEISQGFCFSPDWYSSQAVPIQYHSARHGSPTRNNDSVPAPHGRLETRRVPGAPSPDHNLPWHLLTDVTLEEMLIYYPNHVFNWPGLTLLYSHYVHRNVGNWDYAQVARRIATAHGIDPQGLGAKIRQWLKFSGGELIKNYDPEEADHYKGIYAATVARLISVSEFLQTELQRCPKDLHRPLPAQSLREIGSKICKHPQGSFALRVQTAVRAGFDGVVPPPPDYTSYFHPLIDRLADATMTLSDRLGENTYEHNQSCAPDRYIRPAQRFGSTSYKRRDGDLDGQIWEWFDENTTIIEHLEKHFTREQILRDYWSDLRGDVFLWLDMGITPGEIVRMLPRAALVHNNALNQEGIIKYKATMRKAKQAAFEARVKKIKGSTWDRRKKERMNAPSHEDNRILWKGEKKKFDQWAKEYKRGFYSKKRQNPESEEDGRLTKKSKLNSAGSVNDTLFSNELTSRGLQDLTPPLHSDNLMDPSFYVDPFPPPISDPLQELSIHSDSSNCFHDKRLLYNYDSKSQQLVPVHRLPGCGRGDVPKWWRDQRQDLLRQSGIPFLPIFLDTYFSSGHDILPDADFTGWKDYPGNFDEISAVQVGPRVPNGRVHHLEGHGSLNKAPALATDEIDDSLHYDMIMSSSNKYNEVTEVPSAILGLELGNQDLFGIPPASLSSEQQINLNHDELDPMAQYLTN